MTRALFPLALAFGLLLPNLATAFVLTPLPPPAAGAGTKLPLVLVQSLPDTGCSTDCGGQVSEEPTIPDTGEDTGQQDDAYGSSDRDPAQEPPPAGVPADAVGITPEATKALLAEIDEANRWCRTRYEPGYIPDCIAQAYKRIGATLPWRGGYGKARNALLGGGQRLSEWVEKNQDSAKPTISGRTGRRAPSEPLTPVRASADLNVAAGIIEDTQLVLLRSASGSDQRRVAYEQVANVVGSTVVLLRSGRRKKRRAEAKGRGPRVAPLFFAPRRGAPPPAEPSPA